MPLHEHAPNVLRRADGIVSIKIGDELLHHVQLTTTELITASADSFRDTGRNMAETAAEDPQTAVRGLMKVVDRKSPKFIIDALLRTHPDKSHTIVVEQDTSNIYEKLSGNTDEPHEVARIKLR